MSWSCRTQQDSGVFTARVPGPGAVCSSAKPSKINDFGPGAWQLHQWRLYECVRHATWYAHGRYWGREVLRVCTAIPVTNESQLSCFYKVLRAHCSHRWEIELILGCAHKHLGLDMVSWLCSGEAWSVMNSPPCALHRLDRSGQEDICMMVLPPIRQMTTHWLSSFV